MFLYFEIGKIFILENIWSLWGVIHLKDVTVLLPNMTRTAKFNPQQKRNLKKKIFQTIMVKIFETFAHFYRKI